MRLTIAFLILAVALPLSAQIVSSTGSRSSGGATVVDCAGTPGDTVGAYRSLCKTAAGTLYVCNNASNCTVAADWVPQAGFTSNPAYDGILGLGPAGSSYESGWRAPGSLSSTSYYGLPTTYPSAASVMVFAAPGTRSGNAPGTSDQVADATLKPLSGAGAKVATIETSPADGCAQIATGIITGTGFPCGGGGASTAQGAASAIPGTCTTGALYYTTDSLYTLRCSATNTWSYFIDGQLVTPPSGSWTFDHATGLNGGVATVDTTKKYWAIKAPVDMHQTTDLTLYYTTAPAAPYTRTFMMRPNIPASASGAQGWYVGWQDSGTNKFQVFAAESPNGDGYRGRYGTFKGTSTTNLASGFDVSQQSPGGSNFMTGNVWVRLTDNNTNLIFEISFDGQFFSTLQTVARTSWLSAGNGPDRLVVGIRNTGGTVHNISVNIVGIQ